MPQNTQIYISKRGVRHRYGGIGDTTIYDWLKTTDFPKPYKVGPKLIRWKISELEEWEEKNNGGAA